MRTIYPNRTRCCCRTAARCSCGRCQVRVQADCCCSDVLSQRHRFVNRINLCSNGAGLPAPEVIGMCAQLRCVTLTVPECYLRRCCCSSGQHRGQPGCSSQQPVCSTAGCSRRKRQIHSLQLPNLGAAAQAPRSAEWHQQQQQRRLPGQQV